jgi:hypothetical protein
MDIVTSDAAKKPTILIVGGIAGFSPSAVLFKMGSM